MKQQTRVVVADDHQVFMQGLAALLEAEGIKIVGQTTDRDELLELIEREHPDVAIVDLSMPGVSVQQIAAILRETPSKTSLLILTGCNEPECAVEMLACGAKGYVLKEHTFNDILAAIHAVHRGGSYLSPQIASEVVLRHALKAEVVLTARQLEILRLIARGLTSKRIANQLGIHLKTVDNHRQCLREKLGVHSSAELIHVASVRGLI